MSAMLEHLALHSLGLLGAGLTAALFLSKRRDPETGYRVSVLFVYAALALPLLQLAVSGRLAQGSDTAHGADSVALSSAQLARVSPSSQRPAHQGQTLAKRPLPAAGFFEMPSVAAERALEAQSGPHSESRPLPLALWTSGEPTAQAATQIAGLAPMLEFGYLLGLGIALACALRRLLATHRLIRACRPLTDPAALALWQQVVSDARLTQARGRERAHARAARARLVTHPTLSSPGCWGLWRPVVLVPEGALGPEHRATLECALAHEFVHIQRGDARAALAELVVGCVFWFHPVVHWMRRELARLRETSCDLAVVRRTGRAKSYALALLDCASLDNNPLSKGPLPQGAGFGSTLLHWSHSDSHLRRRIEMLTRHGNDSPLSNALPKVAALALGCAWTAQLATAAVFLPAPPAQNVPQVAETTTALAAEPVEPVEPQEDVEALLAELEGLAAKLEGQTALARVPQHPQHPHAPHALEGHLAVPHVPPVQLFGQASDERVFGLSSQPGQGFFAQSEDGSAPQFFLFNGEHDSNSQSPFALAWGPGGRRLGVSVEDVSAVLAAHLGLDASACLVIGHVEAGSAAERAGLQEHDILTGLPGGRPATLENLQSVVRAADAGAPVEIELMRQGQAQRVQAVFEASDERQEHSSFGWRSDLPKRLNPKPGQQGSDGNLHRFTLPGGQGAWRVQEEHAPGQSHAWSFSIDEGDLELQENALKQANEALEQARKLLEGTQYQNLLDSYQLESQGMDKEHGKQLSHQLRQELGALKGLLKNKSHEHLRLDNHLQEVHQRLEALHGELGLPGEPQQTLRRFRVDKEPALLKKTKAKVKVKRRAI